MNKCKNCQNNCEGEYCFKHKPRKPFPKVGGFKKVGQKFIESANEGLRQEWAKEVINITKRNELFTFIWGTRPHKSEISGVSLGKELLTIFFHHILPKNKYEMACFDEENIILLTPEEHDNVEIDMYRYEEINKRRELLYVKYGLV